MKKNGLVNRSVARMLRRLPRWWRASGSTSTIPEHEEAWLVKHASALLADSEGAVLAGNCVICDSKRAWKPADETDAEPKPALLCWKFAFSLELLLKARGRGSGTWDLTSRENRTHDLQRVWDSLLDVDKEKARRGLSQYSSTLQFDLEIKRVRNAYREFQYLTDSPHRNCKTALKSLVLLNCGFMKGCYDEPRFANVDTGLLNIKTLALDDFSATERIVLEEAQKKGFVLLVRAPGSTTIITDTDMPEQRRRTLQPRTPRESRNLLEAVVALERIRLLEQCGQTQYNTGEHNSIPVTIWELTKAGFEACRKAPDILFTNEHQTEAGRRHERTTDV